MMKNILDLFKKRNKPKENEKSVNCHVCKCGCPLFDFEKMCPDCLRPNPIFNNSY